MIHTQAENRPLPGNFTKTVKLCRTRVCFVGTETLKKYKSVKKTGKHKKRQCFCEKKTRKILDKFPKFINESESAVISSLCLETAIGSHEIR